MEGIDVEWVDEDEWAAIELALAAPTTQQNPHTQSKIPQKPPVVDGQHSAIVDSGEEIECQEGHISKRSKQEHVWIPLPPQPTPSSWRIAPSTCRAQTKCKLPFLQFKGKVVYSCTTEEVDVAAQQIQHVLKKKREHNRDSIAIGFDTEWRIVYNRSEAPCKVATVQLCVDASRSDVMQIIYSGIPSSLQMLLEDSSTFKVGLGAHGDAAKIHKDYNIKVNGVKDLSVLANQKLAAPKKQMFSYKQWSLSSLAQELIGKQVAKDPSIRCGDWEAFPLSHPQLHYAATDAFASLLLYQVLMTFPDPIIEEVPLDLLSTDCNGT